MASEENTKRTLTAEEAALWARIARTVQPLPGREKAVTPPAKAERKALAPVVKKTARPTDIARPVAIAKPTPPPQAKVRRSPPGGTLDRRTRQRMLRGKMPIDARLDLHGHGVEEAHTRLRAFLINARLQGLRTVLVITGKGKAPVRHTLHGHDFWHAPERAGRLRALLPEWLSEAGIAEHVAGWTPAHPSQGGGGAFCIRLRRKDR